MVFKRGNIEISKEHETIGNQITEAEFRGYAIAKLEEINAQHLILREDLKIQNEEIRTELKDEVKGINNYIEKLFIEINKKHEDHDNRLKSLEMFKNQALGALLIIPAVISIGIELFLRWMNK